MVSNLQPLPAGFNMPRFLTPLILSPEHISIDDQMWIVLEEFVYYSDVLGKEIHVPAGFKTDLASVPRIPIIFDLCGDTSQEAAVIHDWLYDQHLCTRAEADSVLREASEASGVPKWRRNLMWAGVRMFGGSHW